MRELFVDILVCVFFAQRFRFCGELDCPDWVLAEIQVLSKLTSIKTKSLVTEVIDGIIDSKDFDIEKLTNLTSGAKLQSDEVRGVAAGIVFIVTSAAKYKTPKDTLLDELQQLGLPKEHATSLCKVYSDKQEALITHLTANSQFFGGLYAMTLMNKDYRLSGGRYTVNVPHVTVKFEIKNDQGIEETRVCFTRDDLNNLIIELESLKMQMDMYSKMKLW